MRMTGDLAQGKSGMCKPFRCAKLVTALLLGLRDMIYQTGAFSCRHFGPGHRVWVHSGLGQHFLSRMQLQMIGQNPVHLLPYFSIMLTKPFSDLDEDTCWLLLGGGAPFEVVYFLKQIEVEIGRSY